MYFFTLLYQHLFTVLKYNIKSIKSEIVGFCAKTFDKMFSWIVTSECTRVCACMFTLCVHVCSRAHACGIIIHPCHLDRGRIVLFLLCCLLRFVFCFINTICSIAFFWERLVYLVVSLTTIKHFIFLHNNISATHFYGCSLNGTNVQSIRCIKE